MKLAKLLRSFVIVCAFSNLLSAQTAPSLENGFKPYGSYEGSQLDSVNLMNGNVIFHAPLMPETPQRGSLKVATTLYSTSQDWQVVCNPGCKWAKGGAGVFVEFSPFLKVHRTLDMDHIYDNMTVQSALNYTIITQSGSVHKLHGVAGTEDQYGEPTQFDSIDLTGFHLTMSGPDSSNVLRSFTVSDRSGNKFEGTILGGHCTRAGNFLTSASGLKGGIYAPMQDDAPVGEQYCSETGITSTVTDSNGNQIFNPDAGSFVDTLGKPPLLLSGTGTGTAADSSDCVSPYAISSAMQYSYQDLNGVSRNVKTCYSFIPIQTAFNVAGVAEDASSSDWQFVGLMTVVYPDKTYWGFNYDNYGELTSIHLPTGGSISYDWETVNYLGCSNGQAYPYSRAVKIRTLDDGRGHTSVWHYNWGNLSGGQRVNTVTDPAGNDTVHTVTDQSPTAGLGAGCMFYETSAVQYLGPSSANNIVQRTDTSYSSTSISTDDGGSSLGNIFATDVITTVYPSGKVKKVHKDPDPGLGAGLPGFGNVIKELDYDWGQGAPGPLLRETDTVYQWQKADASGNKPYLAAHLLDLPASTVVISPTSAANIKSSCPQTVTTTANCMAETDYSYDEAAYFTASSPAVTTQHVAAPWGVRGNQTTVSHWLSTGNTWATSHTNWYDTGEAYQQVDPLGHTTIHSYDAAYVRAYSTKTCSPSTSGVAHCASGTYDFNTGFLTSLTNENATTQASGNTAGDSGHTSNYSYDSMLRLASAQAPPDPANGSVRAQTSFSFPAANVFPFSVQRTKSITASLTDSATSYFDGLGRVYQSQHVLPNGTSTVDTTFDDVHSQVTGTNPYFSTADPTYGSTTTLSDPLGRAIQITEQDGSVKSVAYDVVALSGAAGNCTLTTDEAGKTRRTCADGLGRLVEVDEPNSGAAATYALATVSISGNEQSNPLPAAYGSGYVDIGGVEGTYQSCTDPAPPRQPVCNTAYDTGTVSIQVGSYPAKSASFGNSSTTTATVASTLATAFHNDTSAPADGSISPTNSSRVVLTARNAGSAGNYALSASPVQATAPDFYGTVSGANFTGGRDASSSPDTGTVTITLNGTAYQTTYGGSDTASSIATRLASLISAGSWANASASGAMVTITAKNTGPGGNYSVSASSTYDTAHFGQASFTAAPSASALSGGYDPGVIDNQPLRTLYTYDALGNLLRVDQQGTAPNDSTQWRTRTFVYDSLSRLVTANNPESGTITYSYDADGSLLQKTSPAPNQTGTATQTVSYCYDELHRVTGKGYGAQTCPLATPVTTYTYDSGTNAIGKLTSLTDQAGTASYSYDILGRLAAETRTLTGANNASISKNLSYEYNLDGSLYKLHYPSGNVVTYEPGAAGLALSAKDTGNNINYATSATYGPDSALTGFISGYSTSFAGVTNAFSYNKRLQPLNMSANAPGQTVFSIGYDFHLGNGTSGADNGNVYGITNYKDQTRNQTFTYDALNRLASARNAGTDCTVTVLGGLKKFWGNTYTYDAWGNLLGKSLLQTPPPAACAGENLSVTADARNWIHATGGSDYLYDAAGNMTRNVTPTVQTFTYDQENRLTGAAGYAYTYDADGNRVRKSSSSSTGTLYWYMTPGIVGESDLNGNLTDEYVFFGGERVARKSTNGVFYYFSDHLKTASVITDSAGAIKAESDYYPWGGELQFVNNDSNHYKFTGKERDGETQLDYFGARYYSNGLGRWVSADWSPTPIPVPYADFHDPQSLNLYGYVRNVPTTGLDTNGHQNEDRACLAQQTTNNFGTKPNDWGAALKGAAIRLLNKAFDTANLVAGKIGGGNMPLTGPDEHIGANAMDQVLAALPIAGELKVATTSVEVVDMGATLRAPSVISEASSTVPEGSFSITDWSGYPSNLPQPTGPFRLLEGIEYADARSAANAANRAMHAADSSLDGMHIHEIQPVKFGGSPTDPANKIPLAPADHAPATTWWNQLMRDLQR